MVNVIENLKKIHLPFFTPFFVCLDIGTTITRIAIPNKGIILSEPTCIGQNTKTHEYIFFGGEAQSIIGKTPNFVSIVHPVVNGVISDFDAQVALTRKFVEQAVYPYLKSFSFLRPPLAAISAVPHRATEIEQKALAEVLSKVGFSSTYIIERPIVTAIGGGINIFTHRPHLIIDMGGGLIELTIISGGGIVVEKTLKNAGLAMNHLISNYIYLKYGLILGEATCEELKTSLLNFNDDAKTIMIRGKSLENGLPKSIRIKSAEIKEAVLSSLIQIADVIKEVIEIAPPEIVDEIYDKGILFAGQMTQIPGIDRYFSQELKINCVILDDPGNATIRGLMRLAKNPADLDRLSNPTI
ncbi:rod shape-determining protein [Candidatus Roizmanbacteria bacterium]|nr:rod shape-determining protein [Candidatus Roizmanbacteria bacterium]